MVSNFDAFWSDYHNGRLNDYVGKHVFYRDGRFVAAAQTEREVLAAARTSRGQSKDDGLVEKVVAMPFWIDDGY